jgi:hypothetical protein
VCTLHQAALQQLAPQLLTALLPGGDAPLTLQLTGRGFLCKSLQHWLAVLVAELVVLCAGLLDMVLYVQMMRKLWTLCRALLQPAPAQWRVAAR